MPQQAMDEKLPSGKTVSQAVSASTKTKSTQATLPTEVQEAFKGFLSSVFGKDPATPVPGSAGASTQGTPGVVGGLPPNMVTPPASLSLPPSVVPPAAPPQQRLATAPRGTQFGSPGAAASSAMGDLTNTLVSAIQDNKAKKDADNIAKAQNTMNIFMHAVQQGDMATANLYASDPKVTGMWEKYLKQEYKRVPNPKMGGAAVPSTEKPVTQGPLAGMVSETVPGAPGTGGVNEPGGIAVPRDMTPEGQIKQQQMAAILESYKTMSPQQIAATASQPGVNMDTAALSPEDYKKYSRMKYGLDLTREQEATLDNNAKIAQANYMADVMKYTVGQYSMTQRTAMTAGATENAAKIRAAGAMAVMKEHMKDMKEIQDKKGMALSTAMYEQQMKGYQAMALQLNKDLLEIDPKSGIPFFKSDNPEYVRKKAELERYTQLADKAKEEWEGFKFILEQFPELAGDAEPAAAAAPAEQEP